MIDYLFFSDDLTPLLLLLELQHRLPVLRSRGDRRDPERVCVPLGQRGSERSQEVPRHFSLLTALILQVQCVNIVARNRSDFELQ